MLREERDELLSEWLPELERYYTLFSDFRFSGYRVLIDLISDIDDENALTDRKHLIRDGDSAEFRQLMEAFLDKPVDMYYRDAVASQSAQDAFLHSH